MRELQAEFTPPTVKQHLAAGVKKGKTPVLTAEEARELVGSIETVRERLDGSL